MFVFDYQAMEKIRPCCRLGRRGRGAPLPDEKGQGTDAIIAKAGIPGEVFLTSPIGRTASRATIRLSVETIASSSPMVTRFMPNSQRRSFVDNAIASEL